MLHVNTTHGMQTPAERLHAVICKAARRCGGHACFMQQLSSLLRRVCLLATAHHGIFGAGSGPCSSLIAALELQYWASSGYRGSRYHAERRALSSSFLSGACSQGHKAAWRARRTLRKAKKVFCNAWEPKTRISLSADCRQQGSGSGASRQGQGARPAGQRGSPQGQSGRLRQLQPQRHQQIQGKQRRCRLLQIAYSDFAPVSVSPALLQR